MPKNALRNPADLRLGMDYLAQQATADMQDSLERNVTGPLLKFLKGRARVNDGPGAVGAILNDLPEAFDALKLDAMIDDVAATLLQAAALGRIEADPGDVDLNTGATEPDLIEET